VVCGRKIPKIGFCFTNPVFDGYVEAIVLIYLIIPVLRRSVWM